MRDLNSQLVTARENVRDKLMLSHGFTSEKKLLNQNLTITISPITTRDYVYKIIEEVLIVLF